MRKRKTKRISRFIVFAAAVSLLSVLLTSLDTKDMTVDAASLKHIDEIVAASGTFNILEIVPDAAGASIGYYIDGQEPVSGWKSTLAALTSPAERSDYVNNLFGRLANRGVLSGAETTPLRYTYYDAQNNSYYTETYEADDPENWNVMALGVRESITMTGTFAQSEDGPYRAAYAYAPAPDGGFVQNIYHFAYTDSPDYENGAYYYNPVFTEITPDMDLDAILDYAVYTQDESGFYTVDPQAVTVADVIAAGGFDITDPELIQYYYVDPTQTGAPGEYNYEAVVSTDDADDAPGDGFTEPAAGPSYFMREITSFTYVTTGGNYVYSGEGGETWTVNYDNIYYKAGFINNDLFKKQVFGLDSTSMGALNVTVTVRAAGDVTQGDVAAADLIYLSSGTDITQSGVTTVYTDSNDIPDACAVDIYNFAADRYPVIIDYPIVENITQWTWPSEINRMEKLCLLLLQSSFDETEETSLGAMDYNWFLLYYMYSDMDRTFVNNSVYCFNAFNTQSTYNPPDISTLVTGLFNETFSSQVYESGFSDVLAEIQNENFLREIAGETEMMLENVTVSASVRHIVNFRGRRQQNPKTAITVLDLEPAKVTASTWLTAETVSKWLNFSLDADQITVVHMTTGEFIGKIEDINETYDMIYIGASTESLNTSGGETVYNDTSMKDLIYSNIGDTYRATIEMAGIREQDYVWVDGVKAIDGTQDTNANLFRFSGNDITETKVAELENFAKAGYPLILAGDFVSGGGINTGRVDSSSYMYQAMYKTYGNYGNVMARSFNNGSANSEELIQYLNVSKPGLNITSKPIDYEEVTGSTMTPADDGYYYLEYTFSIGNVTDPTPISTTYDCRLFIDNNADGRFAADEELGDIVVYRVSDGALILPLTDGGGETYALSADIEYRVTRQMPDDYVGIIPWKLEVIKNGADQIHASSEGYTRIAAGVDKETINVLQIMQADTYSSKLNLSEQLVTNGIYGQLIESLEDFDVSIDAIENDELEDIGSSGAILDYLDDYDMLIIGFNDCYDGIGENSAEAIVQYIATGKSVLFTHDTTSLSQVPSYTYPMVTQGDMPNAIELDGTDIIWNETTSEYASINGNVNWYGAESPTPPPYLKQDNPTYVVFLASDVDSANEEDYFSAKAGYSGNYEIYQINNIYSYNYVSYYKQTNVYSSTSLASFKNAHPGTIIYINCDSCGWDSWYYVRSYGWGTSYRFNLSVTIDATKFIGGSRYVCSDMSYSHDSGDKRPNRARSVDTEDYDWIVFCLSADSNPDDYRVVGTYDGAYYWINGRQYWPPEGAPFPSNVLYDDDPSDQYELGVLPHNDISSYWGYYFNTVIRDAVGLDRYGVTSTMQAREDGTLLKDIVDTSESMSYDDIAAVLACERSVAFAPNSGRSATVDEFQGYSNYALIRFAKSNNYNYTNNTYDKRETTNVSQVNKGQITTYPYNVNTLDFGGTDTTITGYGGSYMEIGMTHEQYFQINMNTDDIVVWYCLSSGGTSNNSYYDDVPNDCVNAYYIYNKGNVTYSGVGHTSDKDLYDGSHFNDPYYAEYVNEAKLFVNTMIAAYRAGEQSPTVSIKQDARGTADLTEKFMPYDDDNAEVLGTALDPMDNGRIIYYRISDPNIGQNKIITVSYFVGDADGSIDDAERMELPTYYVDGTPVGTVEVEGELVETLKGGYMYKIYLTNDCLDLLEPDDVYSIKFYVQITTHIGGNPMLPVHDSVELKKQQLFQLK